MHIYKNIHYTIYLFHTEILHNFKRFMCFKYLEH